MMELTERLISELATELRGTTILRVGAQDIDLTTPFRRATMHGLVEEKTGIDFAAPGLSLEDAKQKAQDAGVPLKFIVNCSSIGEVVSNTFEELCEADLIQPTFVLDHPVEISPLAKSHRSKPGLTERFELFICGRELANAYSELNDPVEQRRRFEMQAAAKAAGNDEACRVDEDFLLAMEQGMPPTGGMGLGIDRLAMLLTNSSTIRDVIAFPQLRREAK
jgi:lysyl-tRNA synthetase class 2